MVFVNLSECIKQYTLVEKTKVKLHKKIADENIRLIYGDFKRLYIMDKNDMDAQAQNNLSLSRGPKTIYGDSTLRFYYYVADVLVNPYVGLKDEQYMKNEPIVIVRNNNLFNNDKVDPWDAKIWVQLESEETKSEESEKDYYIVYYVHNSIIENVYNGKKDSSQTMLHELLSKNVKGNKMKENDDQLNIIKNKCIVTKSFDRDQHGTQTENYNLKESFSLYDYQRSDVNWMRDIRKMVFVNLSECIKQYTLVEKTKVKLHKKIADENIRLIYGDFKRLYIMDKNDMDAQAQNNLSLSRGPKTIYGDSTLRFYYYVADVLVNPYVGLKDEQYMKNEPIVIVRNNNLFNNDKVDPWDAKIWVQLESEETKSEESEKDYYIVYYVHNSIIENVYNGKKDSSQTMLHELLSKNVKGNKMKENDDQLNIIKNKCIVTKSFDRDQHGTQTENYNLKESFSLYDYQRSDVNWMRDIENDVITKNNEIKFSYTPITHVLDGRLVLYNNILLPRWLISDNVIDCKDSFRYLGGNLISEIGLGKTMICFSHIFSDLDNDSNRQKVERFVKFKNTCNYCFKRGKNRGNMCYNQLCESSNLYCKTHTSSAFYDKRSIEIINKELFDICDFVWDGKFTTNATLIIAPNQLCDQWTTEYLNKFENNKRVVLVVTSDQYENLKLVDLLFADVVITSYQFISSLHVHRNGIDVERIKSKGAECLTDKSHCVCLHNFKWRRVILDEVHKLGKIAKSKSIITFVSELKSEFKWNVTGTPFANGLLGFY